MRTSSHWLVALVLFGLTSALLESSVCRGAEGAAGLLRPQFSAGQAALEWPQFRGPNRDALCTETGLLQQWPEGGPKLLWKITGLGKGFSSVAIVGGKLFTMGQQKAKGGKAEEFVLAYDLATQRQLWSTRVGQAAAGDGPRATPTIDGPRLYTLGSAGDLVCLNVADGKELWRKSLVRDFGGKMMSVWHFSESPLVDGERLICTPGGKEATLIALDKQSGKPLWKCPAPAIGPKGGDGAGYASPMVAELAGVRQYVQLYGRGLLGVEAESGRFLWGYNGIANNVANISNPLIRGDYLFDSTAYGTGSALVKIVGKGDALRAEQVYFLGPKELQNHHGGMVLVGDYIFCGDGQNAGKPTCVEFATGRICWKAKAPAGGSAAVLYADGHVLLRYDTGPVVLAEANPTAFRVKGVFTPQKGEGPAWAYPVINHGLLYLRHADLLACYDLRPPATPAAQ